jgi:hypothetical protein
MKKEIFRVTHWYSRVTHKYYEYLKISLIPLTYPGEFF